MTGKKLSNAAYFLNFNDEPFLFGLQSATETLAVINLKGFLQPDIPISGMNKTGSKNASPGNGEAFFMRGASVESKRTTVSGRT